MVFYSTVVTDKLLYFPDAILKLTEREPGRAESRRSKARSIYKYSNMAPRLSGQNCKFLKFLSYLNTQKRLE